MNRAPPSPEVIPHETSRVVRHLPLALRSALASATTATNLSARNLLRNLLALAWIAPKVAAAAATANHDKHPSALRIHSEGHNQREPPQRRPRQTCALATCFAWRSVRDSLRFRSLCCYRIQTFATCSLWRGSHQREPPQRRPRRQRHDRSRHVRAIDVLRHHAMG